MMKCKLVIYSFLIVASLQGHSQTKKIDSLKQELLNQKGSARFTILYDLVFECLDKEDFPEALKYIEEAQQVAGRYEDSLHIVKAGRVKGQILQRLDRPADAIVEFQKVLPVSKRNNFVKEYGNMLNSLAGAYAYQGNYDKALMVNFECLVLHEREGNCEEIAVILHNIGVVYYKLENYEKALEYYKRTLDQSYQISFKDVVLVNMGLCYSYLDDFSTAKKFIDDGFKACTPNCRDATIINGEFGLGTIFYLDKPKEAAKHFLVSYEVAKKDKDKRLQIENLIFLGRVNNIRGDYKHAKKFLEMAESIANETEYIELRINIYKRFSELYTQSREYENAAFYQGKYIALNDSLHNGELTKNLMEIHAEFEERENKAKIAAHVQILELKEEAIRRQGLLNLLTGAVAVLFIALAMILVKVNRDKQRVNRLLEQKVKERTQSLEVSLAALQRSHSELGEFIVKTSEEIQRPVITMKGLSNVMLADSDDPQTTRANVKQLEQIISNLAELQKRLAILNERKLQQRNDLNPVKE
jgi:tetratricopeptide (TPR) repeat protein